MLCKAKGKEYIIASHIKPYSKCRSYEASDYKNGLLLCPNHDKLFDLGHITFDDEGKIIVSNNKKEVRILLSDHVNELPKDYKNNQYLKYHRKHIFLDR